MGLEGVLVSLGCVLMGFLVIAFDVVLSCQVMMLGCFFVVFRGFVVCFVCHVDFPMWEISRRDPTRRFVKSSLPVAEDSHGLQEIHTAQKRPPTSRGDLSYPPACWLGSGDDEGIYDQRLDRGLGQNLRHLHVGIPACGDVDKHHIRGVFRPGGADVQFTNRFDCHGCKKEPVRYLNSCRIDQFRAHGASRFSG
jgi:hypothetical protein